MSPKVIALVAHTLLATSVIACITFLAMKGDIPGSTAAMAVMTAAGVGTGGSLATLASDKDKDTQD